MAITGDVWWVKTAGGSFQGNLPMAINCQSRSFGVAERDNPIIVLL